MKIAMKNLIRTLSLSSLALLGLINSISAAPVVRFAAGANPAAIQAGVDQFRTDLGALNPNNGQSFTSGRREINWDGVPDSLSAPNNMPNNFFNLNSPRGVVFSSTAVQGVQSNQQPFQVSSTSASGTPVRFGNLDASYSALFQTFSAQRLFTALNSNIVDVEFFIPGTNIPATVNGFGAVFCDVDAVSATFMQFFGVDGRSLGIFSIDPANNGLSFKGVSFNAGERVSRVRIFNGNLAARAGNIDSGAAADVVVMDDFIYGEPRARDFHSGDADGDGIADARVYRPSVGTWFTLNSGSNTVSIEQFGINGDIPIDGDFDGDQLADLAIYRPSEGGWYVKRSSNGTFITQAFGTASDKPVAGDYDKDGKTDIAVWRPSNGNYFVLRSIDNQSSFFGFPFGQNGDIPVQGGAQ